MSDDPKHPIKLKSAVAAKVEPEPPFRVGASLRYEGVRRLFAEWQMINILEPGQVIEVIGTAGKFSVFQVEAIGHVYTLVISAEEKGEWHVLPT